MSKSGHLRLADARTAVRLLGECRDLGRDGRAWRAHLTAGVMRAVGGAMATAVWIPPTDPDSGLSDPTVLSTVACGMDPPVHRLFVDLYIHQNMAARDITFRRFITLPGAVVVRHRGQVVDNRDWERSEELNERRRKFGVDGILMSRATLPPPDSMFLLTTHRPAGDRPFTARSARLVEFLLAEMARMVGGPLDPAQGGTTAGLPPRLRAVLDRLLLGDGEKQAALALGLSRHTVHEYVGLLYRRYHVRSRAELLARFIQPRGAE
jgi:DNA-binding CsgD family transcriptional regulator